MLAAIIERPHHLELRRVPVPDIKPDEALVKVAASGICGTDLHIYEGQFISRYPLVAGHEFAGIIVKTGAEVEGFAPGDMVACDPSIYCEHCYYCLRNRQNHCENWQALGVTRWGGFAEYVAVPKQCLHKVKSCSLPEAAFIEPLACVVWGLEQARPELGDQVLIYGAGAIGLLHLQMALRTGTSAVTVVDKRTDRLELASRLGAARTVPADGHEDHTLKELAPRGFSLVIDATGVPAVVEKALGQVQNAGKLLIFGVCPQQARISISPYEIYRRDLKIIGSFAIRKTFAQAVDLMESGAVDVLPLIGRTLPLTGLPDALEEMAAGKAPMKLQVQMGE
ncbi:MAG TPA: zinc-dependent alcohol dehydrogenase family protein [Firmicutes bacterium]|nr:zinc-dependent alcohol dehydrogenase family protein [Bacillota bacterium]